ncbi:hypothetical protein EHI8A_021810 [Entamoeba histolytica HM-1:IMSS-B]|uniref:Phorbol-ester/DAG-type domain-containing protein n=4 Tax=Entamoeba histolytica TaxID=5759 RepID=C4M4L0_ENTH1|nr:hypothetical protein EHI_031280 [Entamoeba histolytica HM-1:IMSS]EAL48699.2 hypothetical protein EHI_031280 [Entamoeba histolytica HM-1:IMSS]EMH75412.1 hypothetical protein EHI8A_021810 [Entamoeba histolytica HM-1:IMSS-B]ENY64890.1 hypothetical protein EHI7A_024760 [Entamoeba histolytica HM-1:IMSS-A]|eukprot:XP_654085.2 hypothetical protein EHI_031280 [Entamoeba histolytica HM-1:IMSS]
MKRTNSIALTPTSSSKLYIKKKTLQTRTKYSWSSRRGSTVLRPNSTGSFEIEPKDIPTFNLTEIIKASLSTIVSSSKQLFQLFDSITPPSQFVKRYNEVLPACQRTILLKQMSMALMGLSKPMNLPLIYSFIIDGKLCFDTYPIVLSALAVETYAEIPEVNVIDVIDCTSEILKEFSFLIELLDKDMQRYMTSLGIMFNNELLEKRKFLKPTEFENVMNHDSIIMNLISQGDIEIKEMRKYTKELFCVANSLKTKEPINISSKGIIIRHGSMLLRQLDKYNKRIMINAILILYPNGLQMYLIPLDNTIVESIWISIDNLHIGNITGINGEFYNEGWCVLTIGDKLNNTTYCMCSTNLLTTLMWHDDLAHCINQQKINTTIKMKEILVESNLTDKLPATVFSVIKELILRGCSCFKMGTKLKTKGILKHALQNNPNIELSGVPIEEIAGFFIDYLKEMKPKLFNKNDIDLFNKINYKANNIEESNLVEFFDLKESEIRNMLLSFIFLLNCFVINGEQFSFGMDDAIKLIQIASDSTFKKKCMDSTRIKYIIDNIKYIMPRYTMKGIPMVLNKVSLMKEPIKKIMILSDIKYCILFEQQLICYCKDEELLSLHLSDTYTLCCNSNEYIFIANDKCVTRIIDVKTVTMELNGIKDIAINENILMVAFDNRLEFFDCQTFELIETYSLTVIETIKTHQTTSGFVVAINNKTLKFFDQKGNLLLTKDYEFINKEITVITSNDGIIMIGFNDGSISVFNEINGNELEIIISYEGSIKDITMGNQHYYALTTNNCVLVIDKNHFKILSIFNPFSIISSLLITKNEVILMSSFNSLFYYQLNNPPICSSINLSPFFMDIPQSMSSLNHSFVPNISHINCVCSVCNKTLFSNDFICRYCHTCIHINCLSLLKKDCIK